MKKNKHIILLGLLMAFLVIMEYLAPKKPDWKTSFEKDEKIPFGSYIPFDLLADVFPNSKIEQNHQSIYKKLGEKSFQNTSLIIITDNFAPEHVNLESLLWFVSMGNKAFIAASTFGKEISDTLHFNSTVFFNQQFFGDSLPYHFKNPNLGSDSAYWIKSGMMLNYFDDIDTLETRIIATMDMDKVNFIKIPYGSGEFFLHNQPYAFTNYNILFKNNAEYFFKSFSYLKNNTIIWDEHYKPGRSNSTPLIYILEQKALKAAWYMVLGLAILFMVFGAKRKQRIIPVILPKKNSSLEFAKTLGNLYLSNKNHKDIALKKYNYWLDFLRENYFLHIEKNDITDIDRISEKTGVNVERLINAARIIEQSSQISQEQLMGFNQLIENFYRLRK